MNKKFATALCLTLALSVSIPASAMTRDGGPGRDIDPIQRIIRIIRQILHPITHADPLTPHP